MPIEHSFIDFWSLILHQKIQAANAKKQGTLQTDFKVEMNDYILSFFIEKIVLKCPEEIEEQDIIKKIIDCQFMLT
jgi:hypothetical protein